MQLINTYQILILNYTVIILNKKFHRFQLFQFLSCAQESRATCSTISYYTCRLLGWKKMSNKRKNKIKAPVHGRYHRYLWHHIIAATTDCRHVSKTERALNRQAKPGAS